VKLADYKANIEALIDRLKKYEEAGAKENR